MKIFWYIIVNIFIGIIAWPIGIFMLIGFPFFCLCVFMDWRQEKRSKYLRKIIDAQWNQNHSVPPI